MKVFSLYKLRFFIYSTFRVTVYRNIVSTSISIEVYLQRYRSLYDISRQIEFEQ